MRGSFDLFKFSWHRWGEHHQFKTGGLVEPMTLDNVTNDNLLSHCYCHMQQHFKMHSTIFHQLHSIRSMFNAFTYCILYMYKYLGLKPLFLRLRIARSPFSLIFHQIKFNINSKFKPLIVWIPIWYDINYTAFRSKFSVNFPLI